MATGARQHRALERAGIVTAEVGRVDGWDAVENFYQYVLAAHDQEELVSLFGSAVQRMDPTTGGEIMGRSVADKLMAKGHAEGKVEGKVQGHAEGRVEVLEGLVKAGVGWEVIEAATGLDERAFQALREQVASRL